MSDGKPVSGAALVRLPEQATAANDITLMGWNDVLRPQDDVLAQRAGGKGLKLYRELARDAHAAGVLDKRKGAVIARSWVVEPGGPGRQDRKAAELLERIVAGEWGLDFDGLCSDLLAAQLEGFAVGEILWAARDGFVVPLTVKARDQRRFAFDRDWTLRLLTPSNQFDGEPVVQRKFIVHRFGSAFDPYGLGLGHRLFWPIYFKRNALQFWAVFCEKFGMPTVKATYAGGVDPDDLLKKLQNVGRQAVVVVPEGTVLDLLEGARAAGVDTYATFLRYLDEQISEAVLGETLTTNIGTQGSRAASETHNAVREEVTDRDADELSATLHESFVAWICEANYPDARPPTLWRPRPERRKEEADTRKAEAEARKAAAEFVTLMRRTGWEPIDPEASLEDQAAGEWRYTGQASGVPEAAPPATAASAAPGAGGAAFAAPPRRKDHADELADQVEQTAGPAFDAIVDRIRAEVDQAVAFGETPQQMEARLARLSAELPLEGLVDVLRDGMMAAALAGMDDQNGQR